METDIYVGNLASTVTEDALRAAFAAAGTVKHVTIMRQPRTGRSRGFGFVRLSSPDEAAGAIRTLNGTTIEGQAMKVSDARERISTGRDGRRFDEDGGFGGPRTGGPRRSGGSKRRS